MPRCWLCDGDARYGQDLCRACARELPWLGGQVCPTCALPLSSSGRCGACLSRPGVIRRAVAALRYEHEARQLVHAYKFHRDLVAGRVLAQALLDKVSDHCRERCLIPITTTDERLRKRGFDPALEIARYLGSHSRGSRVLSALARRDSHAAQSSLNSKRTRRDNVRRVFHVKQPGKLASIPVVTLVDDVLTTGATANAAARVLLAHGVSTVDLWVCARTP